MRGREFVSVSLSLLIGLLATAASQACVPGELKLSKDAGARHDAAVEDATAEAAQDAASEQDVDAGYPDLSTWFCVGQSGPKFIRLDGDTVYFANTVKGQIMACPITGCDHSPTPLIEGIEGIAGLEVKDGYAYWTSSGSSKVKRCPVGDCTAKADTLASQQNSPTAVTIDGTVVVWSNSNALMAMLLGLPGAGAFTLAKGQNRPGAVLFGGSSLFWLNQGTTAAAAAGALMNGVLGQGGLDGVAALASSQSAPSGLAVDDQAVFWTNLGASAGKGEVWTIARNGSAAAPELLAHTQADPTNVALDAQRVYWTNNASGQVLACSRTACGNPVVLSSGGSTPWDIAVSADAIFWTDPGLGRVLKIPKN